MRCRRNLLKPPVREQAVVCSPSYGPYYIFKEIAEANSLHKALADVYGEDDGKRLLGLEILSVTNPCSTNLLEETVEHDVVENLRSVRCRG